MSRHLVDRIAAHPNVDVACAARGLALDGDPLALGRASPACSPAGDALVHRRLAELEGHAG